MNNVGGGSLQSVSELWLPERSRAELAVGDCGSLLPALRFSSLHGCAGVCSMQVWYQNNAVQSAAAADRRIEELRITCGWSKCALSRISMSSLSGAACKVNSHTRLQRVLPMVCDPG